MHVAAAHVVGASVEACRQVLSGDSLHSASIVGGLHHAMADRSSGFCIYNDIAVGIQYLLDNGVERVAYVDVDVHHGDGVEKIFYDDPRVLTISLHETGQMLFPGTGFPQDSGGEGAEGSAVNVALPPGTADGGWLRAFHAVVPPLLREFKPQILVTQHGCDSHMEDPLAHLMLSVDGQRAAYLALHELAHELCDGKWVVTGGGGYALVEVVPAGLDATCSRSSPASRSTRRPRPRPAGVPTSTRSWVVRRRTDSPTAATRPIATGPRATTPRRGSTARSWPRGPRSSRCTGSTPPATPRRDSTRHAARPTSFSSHTLPHRSHWPYCRDRAPRTCDTGGEAGAVARKVWCTDGFQDRPETCPTSSS